VRVRRTDLVRYAGASGDFNPIHYSDHVARSVGLSGVIAHGMLTMGIAARTVTDVLASPADLKEYSTKFVKPVRVPDDMVGAGLSLGAIVRKELDDAVQIDVAAQARGEKVLGMAKAIVRLPTETRNAK
jgi:acyl dehydratase